jgi:hypothetical protein
MPRSRSDAVILVLGGALLCGLANLSGSAAWAQPVSSARLVPSPVPSPPGSAGGPAVDQPSRPLAPTTPTTPTTPTVPTTPTTPTASSTPQGASAGAAAVGAVGVGGRVIGNSSPLAAAGVYAYQLANLTLHKVETDPQGNFLFRNLPAGLYKIIANKPGFMPAVILLTRTTAQAYQFLELQMAQGAASNAGADAARSSADPDFWALRASIPPDVLRDIDAAEPPDAATKSARAALPGDGGAARAGSTVSNAALASRFRTEVLAMTGVADVAQVGVGQVSTGKLGIEGQLGAMAVGLSGNFWQMSSDGPLPGAANRSASIGSSDGQTSALSLNLQPGASSKITLDSVSDHLLPRTATGSLDPVGLDHYQVSWSQALGESSRSDFSAQYTNENNYHRQGPIDPADIPDASRTWRVEGSYTTGMGDEGSVQAGFRYSELQLGASPLGTGFGLAPLGAGSSLGTPVLLGSATSALSGSAISPGHQTVDFFSRGSTRLQPAFMVEYGLFTTLQDGSLSLTPQGGVVLKLDKGWQVDGTASHQIYQEQSFDPQFLPTMYKESELCEQGSRACYELTLANHSGDDTVSLSAIERIVGQTLRLYFSDAVFDRQESLYLVAGDRLPELRLVMSRRISPNVKTSLESSVASGGGGIFMGGDGHLYQNQVRYVVTSLNTHILNTATGVFLAFHHISQDLGPAALASVQSGVAQPTAISFDRVQLMLSQDLNFIWNLAAEWALQVNMELSRGQDPTDPAYAIADTQLHRRILGGIAVKF